MWRGSQKVPLCSLSSPQASVGNCDLRMYRKEESTRTSRCVAVQKRKQYTQQQTTVGSPVCHSTMIDEGRRETGENIRSRPATGARPSVHREERSFVWCSLVHVPAAGRNTGGEATAVCGVKYVRKLHFERVWCRVSCVLCSRYERSEGGVWVKVCGVMGV